MNEYSEKAMKLFKEGYNCSQAVVGAFVDDLDIDMKTAMLVSSSFGGGMGRLREVCGAVSGMFMVAGLANGYDLPADLDGKKELYTGVQHLAHQFKEENRSIVCRELLGLNVKTQIPTPDLRTPEYYKKRPCVELVGQAAGFISEYIASKK